MPLYLNSSESTAVSANGMLGTVDFATDDVLCLPKGTIAARSVYVFVTFASSGTLNTLVDGTAEITTSESSAMTLFII